MSKRMIIMLILTGLLFGGIIFYKVFKSYMVKQYIDGNSTMPVTVSSMQVISELWYPKMTFTGSVRSIKGVDITTEIAGLVKAIKFIPGQGVKTGDVILELNANVEIAQLHSLEAQTELALITYNRDKEQYVLHAVSKAVLDTDEANLKSLKAQVDQQAAILAKKTICAPFSGRLGICKANLGQYLNPGDTIVALHSLHPIYVDFYVPQQNLPQIAIDQYVTFTTDTYPNLTFKGKITTINPKIDIGTRNVEVEATVSNPENKLLPGMYGLVDIKIGAPQEYLTLPQTAISYNPYGDLVYILKANGKDKKGTPLYLATQKFVTLGETRRDQVQIVKGLEKGDVVVTAGQLKLKNGSLVIINNTDIPKNSPNPLLENE